VSEVDEVDDVPEIRTVPAGRVLRLLGLGMLLVAVVDLVAVAAIVGWIEGARAHPGRTSGRTCPSCGVRSEHSPASPGSRSSSRCSSW